jgi:hypothetical protein
MTEAAGENDVVVRRDSVVRTDARLRAHIPSGPMPVVIQSEYGPIRVFVSQRGSVIASPARDHLEHEGYRWNAVMEFTYYGESFVGPLEVVRYPENPRIAQPVSRDNIVRALRKASSTFMLKQEASILPLAIKDIAIRKNENEDMLRRARADLAALPSEKKSVLARRFDSWCGTLWVSPAEGELAVQGGGFSGSITVSGKICQLSAALPLEHGRELQIVLVNIFASEKREEVPPMLRSSLLELAEVVRRNHPDLVEAATVLRARRRLQVDIATYENTLKVLDRFDMMYRDRLDPAPERQYRATPSSAA